jgi:putative ABC transport system permease protein
MREAFDTLKLVKRNLAFYRLQTFQVILAIALTTAIISGAFLIGASVKSSLKNSMQNRLGKVTYGVFQAERWFKADLETRVSVVGGKPCAALISVPAYVNADKGQTIKVMLYGIDSSFFMFAPEKSNIKTPLPGNALINRTTALMLGSRSLTDIAVRCFKPSLVPGDTAWSNRDSGSVGFRLQVTDQLAAGDFGDFSPINTQLAPANIFVDRDWLAERLGRSGRANVLLCSGYCPQRALPGVLKLDDYGISLKKLSNNGLELKSDRVFIAPTVVSAVDSLQLPEQKIFTYFANSITANNLMTPYSFISGVNRAPGGIVLSGREAAVNKWLADDLKLKVGDSVGITYYKFGPQGELQDASAAFRVKAIIPVSRDPDLMPKFPGMSDAASCSDWDPGIPIKLKLIRAKDEAYWDKYRGTPKIFIALDTAQKLWGCRFGKLTAIRFRGDDRESLAQSLLLALNPADVGFAWRSLLSTGKYGVANAVDFSGLFFGLSFFVIIAGIALSGLLYRLHLEQRASEFAVLKSMGYSNHHLRRILMLEAVVVLTAGIVVGIIAAFGYSYMIITALNTVWNDIAGSIQVSLNANPQAICLGAAISVPVIAAVLFFALRKILKSDLQGSLVKADFHRDGIRIYSAIAIPLLLIGAIIIILGVKTGGIGVGAFFGAASMLFVGMVCLSGVIIRLAPECLKGQGISTIATALRNNSRHFRRSMAVIVIMALGLFLTLAVSVNRTRIQVSGNSKKSGTGGFGWYIETAIPVKGNLNSQAGRKRYRMALPPTLNILQLPMVDGGAAGCLNLNRVTRPRLLGVPPGIFYDRFSFNSPDIAWSDLQKKGSDVIPAIADKNVILWSLGLKVGDTLNYPGADGKVYKLKLIAGLNNSIFQGSVLISRFNLRRMFPDVSGSRVLLMEKLNPNLGLEISHSLAKLGPDVETCTSRLNRFGAIQNTYLMVFLSLGGIGLIIGTLGLSIILRRNLLERRSELAWLRSAGFSRRRIAFMLTVEHMILFDCALLTGIIAAAAAAIPAILSPSGNPPWLEMIILVFVLWAFAVIFIVTSAYRATKGDIISGLRGDSE